MTNHLDHHGYGTGPQLLAAAVRTFVDVAESIDAPPLSDGFRLSYRTTIPRQVGLGGSSALVVATLRCLSEHYGVDLPNEILPSVALRAETVQLGLAAGLQDRVVQTYGGLVAMDFGDPVVDTRFGISHGVYEPEDPTSLPALFLAYREGSAEPSDAYHQRLRSRFEVGDSHVRETLRELAGLVVEGRAALRWKDSEGFASLIGRNMQLRRLLGPIPPSQLELVEVAASANSQATFAGSGGAVVGTFDDDQHFELLSDVYADIGADIVAVEGQNCPVGDHEATTEADVVALEPRHLR
ncbi:MAG: GHMP kinase [Actinomycetia bacterium]|nr:GHMP kinase [Actinomycetes bacterium]